MAPALKALLSERHLHEYRAFTVAYRDVVRDLALPSSAEPPTKATYYHWLSGQMLGLPRGYHCLVLERMFPGWSAQELFSTGDGGGGGVAGGLLATITPTVDASVLTGLWCTAYLNEGSRHADLTTISSNSGVLTARNYPPTPRREGRPVGYSNDIAFSLSGRHLIGQWRNASDSYYYGTVHLAVLPGEALLDGYYTSVVTDARVESERWRWVRVDPATVAGADMHAVKVGDPRHVYDLILNHSDYGPPIELTRVVEAQ
ncbi:MULTISPECIES: hypothetical protein [Mycolicibacter]|uniref:Uncharacterized protein n=1 Tax=[Mycobacterium] nativiensis TaxID=2855503 RepID=A0ABU5Y0G0_9MYCO|nr:MULTISPECIES: hypothetical protein [unclassified Mycolicibacter]MEB3033737.1 hypothetical protein [Mycolicibacter sp. MYC340]